MFLDTSRAMEMRPASQEERIPTGKHPGLIGMFGTMVSKNMERPPHPIWNAHLGTGLVGYRKQPEWGMQEPLDRSYVCRSK